MATIKTAIALYDGVTSPLKHMKTAMDVMLNSFESMQRASHRAVDVAAIQSAREELARAGTAFDSIEQKINESDQKQRGFNESIHKGNSAAGGLLGKFKSIAVAIGSMMGAKKILELSDAMAGNEARLSLIVDDGGSVADLEKKIMASAQRSRSYYMDTAQSVAKLGLLAGDAFSGNDEMIRFAELMNKNFVIAGASAQEQSSAMYQLNQALGSGRLQGDEYRSIIENAPLLAKAIEDYMRNVQGAKGTMKEWASEGLLTADVIKSALFSSADEVEERFDKMPKTWSQVWTGMKNHAISVFSPILARINEIANTEKFESTINGIIGGLAMLASALGVVLGLVTSVGGFVSDNWSWLSPIILGVAAALGVYYGRLLLVKGAELALAAAQGIVAVAKGIGAAATMVLTGATWAQVTAQHNLNAAMYACPLVWIAILVIALIALFYAAVAAVNKFAGTSVSATGIICGAFMTMLAIQANILIMFWNLVVDVFARIYNTIAMVANFLGNVFTDPVGAVCRLFFDLADTVLGVLQSLAGAIDTLFGSNLANSVQSWRDSLGGWVDNKFGQGVEIMAKVNPESMKLGRFEYGAAWGTGYNFGKGLGDKTSNAFDPTKSDPLGAYDLANGVDKLYSGVGDTAKNTAKMADALDASEKDLKLLREIAERQAINQFTTAKIQVEMTNHNSISSDQDLDGIVRYLEDAVEESMNRAAEGVHV